jgi:methylaspartate ammonia-lyase
VTRNQRGIRLFGDAIAVRLVRVAEPERSRIHNSAAALLWGEKHAPRLTELRAAATLFRAAASAGVGGAP